MDSGNAVDYGSDFEAKHRGNIVSGKRPLPCRFSQTMRVRSSKPEALISVPRPKTPITPTLTGKRRHRNRAILKRGRCSRELGYFEEAFTKPSTIFIARSTAPAFFRYRPRAFSPADLAFSGCIRSSLIFFARPVEVT